LRQSELLTDVTMRVLLECELSGLQRTADQLATTQSEAVNTIVTSHQTWSTMFRITISWKHSRGILLFRIWSVRYMETCTARQRQVMNNTKRNLKSRLRYIYVGKKQNYAPNHFGFQSFRASERFLCFTNVDHHHSHKWKHPTAPTAPFHNQTVNPRLSRKTKSAREDNQPILSSKGILRTSVCLETTT
jgi:hypothetical protein